MSDGLSSAAIGLVAGYLAGQFGIGGAVLTTPAIRLLLDVPPLVAVGTPLLAVVPTAGAGAIAYGRRSLADVRAGILIGGAGGITAVPAAMVASWIGGPFVLVLTAALICWMAVDSFRRIPSEGAEMTASATRYSRLPTAALLALGGATGAVSGFLGIGGGFLIVPALVRWAGLPIKRAIGTSLVAVCVLAVPGSLAHLALGNIDLLIASGLGLGGVVGSILGARVTAAAADRTVRRAFAAVLLAAGSLLAVSELGLLP